MPMSRHVAARLLPPTAAYMSRDPEGEWNEEADSLGGTHRRRTRSARHRANRGCAWPEARGRGVVVSPRKRRPARHQSRVRQRPLLEGQPERASDLEQMPHLLDFLKQYGTVFSNSHTPLIAHTANDSLAIYSGLYGDRHGQPLSNSYKTYNPDGSTDPA